MTTENPQFGYEFATESGLKAVEVQNKRDGKRLLLQITNRLKLVASNSLFMQINRHLSFIALCYQDFVN
jgi:hypothetical protein